MQKQWQNLYYLWKVYFSVKFIVLLTFTDHVLHYCDLSEQAVHFFNSDTLMSELKSSCQPCNTRFNNPLLPGGKLLLKLKSSCQPHNTDIFKIPYSWMIKVNCIWQSLSCVMVWMAGFNFWYYGYGIFCNHVTQESSKSSYFLFTATDHSSPFGVSVWKCGVYYNMMLLKVV